jgi:hypothetical protein
MAEGEEIILGFDKNFKKLVLTVMRQDDDLATVGSWIKLAGTLETPRAELERLKSQAKMDLLPHDEVIREIFEKWISLKGKESTLKNLCKSLNAVDLNILAGTLFNNNVENCMITEVFFKF